MTANENRELLRRVYAGVSRGDPQPLLNALADDACWTIIGTTALSGVFHGKAEIMEELLTPLRARLADGPIRFEPEGFIAEGEHVVMLAKAYATARSGAPYNNTYCIVARIVDGRILEITDYIDTALIDAVLGR